LRGLKIKEGGKKEGVEGLMESLGVNVNVEWVRKLGAGRKERGNMILAKLGSEEEKCKVWQNK